MGEVLRGLLLLFSCLALLGGQWQPGLAALGLLLLAKWLRASPPVHVQEALASPGGQALREVVLEVALRDVLAEAHARGIPVEAAGVLLQQLGEDLQRGRVQALAVELHEGRHREGRARG